MTAGGGEVGELRAPPRHPEAFLHPQALGTAWGIIVVMVGKPSLRAYLGP